MEGNMKSDKEIMKEVEDMTFRKKDLDEIDITKEDHKLLLGDN